MDTPAPPSGDTLLDGDVDTVDEPVAAAPPVVAVVITDGAPGLEATLGSLAAQEYPALSVLVLDRGAAEDPTARIAAVSPRAFVRRLGDATGFASAANDVLTTVEGATFLLFCSDDVVFEQTAVHVLVEEAYRSNAAIVGPKVVDRDRPQVLLEVGLAIDHYGVPYSGLEPGEIDQEQHDAVRDVFFVSGVTMLVRADLFFELGGFDPATEPGAYDLDLCWRARLAGARVLVAPDARVGHPGSGVGNRRAPTVADEGARNRARIRVLLKSYSALALVWVVPTAFLLNLTEVLALAATRRFARARGVLGAWWANLYGLRDVMRARRQVQSQRRVGDHDVRELMIRGSARVRTFFAIRLHAPARLQDVSVRTRAAVGEARVRVLRPEMLVFVALLAVILFGSRSLVSDRVPVVGTFLPWPSVGSLLGELTSPWRNAALGSDGAAPPILAMMAAFGSVLFGNTDVARMLVVIGALPLGAVGVHRVCRPLAASAWPAVAAAIAYGVNPLARNAIARGRLGPLVFYALAPFLLGSLLRAISSAGAGREADQGGDEAQATSDRLAARRPALVLVGLGALATAWWPPAVLFGLLAGLAFLLAAPMVGGGRLAGRTLVVATIGAVGSLLVLLPWIVTIAGGGSDAVGLLPRSPAALGDVLRFHTGPAGTGFFPWGLLVAAALPLALATGARLAWAARAWMMVVVSFTLAWLPGRIDADLPLPVTDGVLVPAALGLALAVGLGVAAFVADLRRFLFGWRQFAAVVGAFGLALPILGLVPDTLSGRWRMPSRDWNQALSWMAAERPQGSFRVLWLGDADVLPVDARSAPGIGYGLSRNGTGDVRELFPPSAGEGDATLEQAIGLVGEARTARFGHLLAPMGVRYVALVQRAGAGGGATSKAGPRFERALAEQLDLAVVQSERGILLYENEAWAAGRSVVSEDRAAGIPVGDGDPIAAAVATSIDDAEPVTGPLTGSRPAGPGLLLWSEHHADGWRARAGGELLEPQRTFGWANGFTIPAATSVSISYEAGILPRLALVYEMLAWFAVAALWWRSRRAPVPPSFRARRDSPQASVGAAP